MASGTRLEEALRHQGECRKNRSRHHNTKDGSRTVRSPVTIQSGLRTISIERKSAFTTTVRCGDGEDQQSACTKNGNSKQNADRGLCSRKFSTSKNCMLWKPWQQTEPMVINMTNIVTPPAAARASSPHPLSTTPLSTLSVYVVCLHHVCLRCLSSAWNQVPPALIAVLLPRSSRNIPQMPPNLGSLGNLSLELTQELNLSYFKQGGGGGAGSWRRGHRRVPVT